jgi:exodeoxyribonuclease VII small subunit
MPKPKEPNLEEQIERLEALVEKMENPETSLDSSLALFEEGVKLAKSCQSKLTETQKKIEILMKETGDLEPYDA